MFYGSIASSVALCSMLMVICGIWCGVLVRGLAAHDDGRADTLPQAAALKRGVLLTASDIACAGLAIIMFINYNNTGARWFQYLAAMMVVRTLYVVGSFVVNATQGVRYPTIFIANGALHSLTVATIALRLWQFSMDADHVWLQHSLYHACITLFWVDIAVLAIAIAINVVSLRRLRTSAASAALEERAFEGSSP